MTTKGELITRALWAGREHSTSLVQMIEAMSNRRGLGASDGKALDFIFVAGVTTPGDVANRLGLTTGSVTALLDRLEGKGFVTRSREGSDRRRVSIRPNSARRAEFEAMMRPFVERVQTVLESYSVTEICLITDFLNRTSDIARSVTAEIVEG